jgi:hypothetical protein
MFALFFLNHRDHRGHRGKIGKLCVLRVLCGEFLSGATKSVKVVIQFSRQLNTHSLLVTVESENRPLSSIIGPFMTSKHITTFHVAI